MIIMQYMIPPKLDVTTTNYNRSIFFLFCHVCLADSMIIILESERRSALHYPMSFTFSVDDDFEYSKLVRPPHTHDLLEQKESLPLSLLISSCSR